MIRIVATSRQAVSAIIFLVVLCGLAVVFGRPVLQIDFTEDAPGVKLPFVELLAIVAGMGLLMLLYPRFWQLERVASSGRTKVVAGLVALVGMIAPLFVLIPSFIALSKVPDVPEGLATAMIQNVLTIGALAHLASPRIGPSVAGGIAITGWFLVALLANLRPGLASYMPITFLSEYDVVQNDQPWNQWSLTCALVLLALIVQTHTLGRVARNRVAD